MYAVSIVTRLLNEGLLDLNNGDLVFASNESEYLFGGINKWEASAFAEFKVNHSATSQRASVPLRTTCKRLKRLYKECKQNSIRAMRTASLMYQVGFILPKSEILNQSWSIFATGDSPEIGGKVITYKEVLKLLRKHIREANATSAEGKYVYCKEYQDKVERWSECVSKKDDGFLVYAFSPQTNTYTMTDAFILHGDKWLSVYAIFSDLGSEKKYTAPTDIGKFAVSAKDARIIVPFTHNDPELTDDERTHLTYLNIFRKQAFANTLSNEEATISKFQMRFENTMDTLDSMVRVVMDGLVNSRVSVLQVRKGITGSDLSKKRKALIAENQRTEQEAYAKYESKLARKGEKVAKKYYAAYKAVSDENQEKLRKLTEDHQNAVAKLTSKVRKVLEEKHADLLTVKLEKFSNESRIPKLIRMSDAEREELLDHYKKLTNFISAFVSSRYDAQIESVNKNIAKHKRYDKDVRDIRAALKDVKTDKKTRELTKALNKSLRLRDKYRDRRNATQSLKEAERKTVQLVGECEAVIKEALKNPTWITVNVNSRKSVRLQFKKKFEVRPSSIVCVTPNRIGRMKNGVTKKLKAIGFTV